MIKEAKESGWVIRKDGDDWVHMCPICSNAEKSSQSSIMKYFIVCADTGRAVEYAKRHGISADNFFWCKNEAEAKNEVQESIQNGCNAKVIIV
jgi:hypothetical protein